MRKVFCLINGEGVVVEETADKIVVEFTNEKGLPFKSYYTKDGRLIFEDGIISKSRVLFDHKPYIVVDNAILDEGGKVIEDKDFIVFGKRGSFVFNAGFFDATNLSLFTKDGNRNPNKPLFKKLSPDIVIYKIENPQIEELKKELTDLEEKTKTEIFEKDFLEFKEDEIFEPEVENEEQPLDEEPLLEVKEEEPIEKKAEENDVAEPFFSITIDNGEFLMPRFPWLQLLAPDLMQVKIVDKKVSVSFSKRIDGADASATISFKPEAVYKVMQRNKPEALKDVIEVFDVFVEVVDKNGKKMQKNLDENALTFKLEDQILKVDFA